MKRTIMAPQTQSALLFIHFFISISPSLLISFPLLFIPAIMVMMTKGQHGEIVYIAPVPHARTGERTSTSGSPHCSVKKMLKRSEGAGNLSCVAVAQSKCMQVRTGFPLLSWWDKQAFYHRLPLLKVTVSLIHIQSASASSEGPAVNRYTNLSGGAHE